jgi:phosphohistidine phosphatase
VKTLLILRHAKSSWDDSAVDDHERPLNARGEKDAPRMGRLLRTERLLPELIVSSDALRARRTAEAIAAVTNAQLLLDSRLYHASAAEVLEALLSDVQRDVATVMVVGHNPGLEELIAQLTGEREVLPTAALAQIELQVERWSDLRPSTPGILVGLWRPKELP